MAANRFEVPENETLDARRFSGRLPPSNFMSKKCLNGLGTGSKWDVY
jgi:hypothetical protein